MIEDTLKNFGEKSKKTIDVLGSKLATFRTGRATVALVENLMIDSYGTKMPLKSVASISVPETKVILLQPWDKTNIPAIEKALLTSDLGGSPQTEESIIRVVIPPLTGERREEYKKLVKQEVERSKVVVRSHRKDAINEIKAKKENKELSEDEEKRAKDVLQKEVEKQMKLIEDILSKKLEDLNQV